MTVIQASHVLGAGRGGGLLAGLAAVVGDDHVLADAATIERYSRSAAGRASAALAVVRPGSHDEVVALMAVARSFGIAVHPLNSGRNAGFGEAGPLSAGQLLLDLARMNRIVHVDQELAYAIIEPGVTQQQMSDYLLEHGCRLWFDCSGAASDTSLMGNILERGFGNSPCGNRLQHVSGMQVVLASGDVLHTGFGHYREASATHLFPYGVGPFLDGIFTQSNLGVVTRIGIWLMPMAQCVSHFFCTVPRQGDLGPVIDALRPLRLDGSLRSALQIGNDLRMLAGGAAFPARIGQSCHDKLRADLRHHASIGAWLVSGALYGSADQVAAARKALRGALKSLPVKASFLSERRLPLGETLARLLGASAPGRRLRAHVELSKALFAMNRGVPSESYLAGAYWRRRSAGPADTAAHAGPARDQCAMQSISPILPMRGADTKKLLALIDPVFREHGFGLFISFSMVNERALAGLITVAYDRDDSEEAARATRCYHAVFNILMAAGYIPHRAANRSMADLDPDGDTYWSTVAKIKQVLDPDGLIAPGRYEPGKAGEPQPPRLA